MKRLVLVLGLAVVIGIASVAMWMNSVVTRPLSLQADGYVFEIAAGSSLTSVARNLEREGVLDSARAFVLYARLQKKADRIQAGEYEVASGTTGTELLDQLVAGRVKLHTLTVIEGSTFRELLGTLAASPHLNHTLEGKTTEEIMTLLGKEDMHPEGLFFPDTYSFPKGTDDIAILIQAADLLDEKLNHAWDRRLVGLPLKTPYDALILASIVEKETALETERPRIAGVFVNRLNKRMYLQTDPTVIYGLGENFDGDIRRRDLTTDTPYNTYTRRGLPPTPIALAGAASIEAVMQPESTAALYFVATGEDDGSHYFSTSLDEHNAAVRRYLRRRRGE